MKPTRSHADAQRLERRVRSAWIQINQAGDTPDAQRSILCLDGALHEILVVASAIQPGSSTEQIVAQFHHSVMDRSENPATTLNELIARAKVIRERPKEIVENVPDARLVHQAIPILWRLVRALRSELRRHRPWPNPARWLRRTRRALMGLAVIALLILIAREALPWGVRVRYYSGRDTAPLRGWAITTALMKDYGTNAPLPWMSRKHWSARTQGILVVPETADYSFFAQCEGGMRFWIDDDLLVDNWESRGWTAGRRHAEKRLTAGRHSFRLELRNRGDATAVRIRWTGGSIPPNTTIGFPHLRKY